MLFVRKTYTYPRFTHQHYFVKQENISVIILIKNIPVIILNIGYCNTECYKCPPNEQYKY